jgi:serine/threonine-protein kinase
MGDEPTAGAVVAGRYRLDGELGRGGMGSVWRGVDLELERVVAIKFMSREVAVRADLRERFTLEAKAAAKLRTRHVAHVFDFGLDGNTPFIVMEHLSGRDLRRVLIERERLEPSEVVDIVRQAARALKQAQAIGIVHRDLKPANMFMAMVDDERVLKILDFGVAKDLSQPHGEHTRTGVLFGSPPYLSPEQARGFPVDHRGDLWALAAVAYRCLTGKLPFDGQNEGDTLVKICTEAAPPPSTWVPSLPLALDAFFVKAFAKDRSDRFQDAPTFARTLADAAGLDPISMSAFDASKPVNAVTAQMVESTPPSQAEKAASEAPTVSLSDPTSPLPTATSIPPSRIGKFTRHQLSLIAAPAIALVVAVVVLALRDAPLAGDETAAAVPPPPKTPTAPVVGAAPPTETTSASPSAPSMPSASVTSTVPVRAKALPRPRTPKRPSPAPPAPSWGY